MNQEGSSTVVARSFQPTMVASLPLCSRKCSASTPSVISSSTMPQFGQEPSGREKDELSSMSLVGENPSTFDLPTKNLRRLNLGTG